MNKKEYQNKGKSVIAAVGIGSLTSFLVMLIGVMVIALLVMNQTIEASAISYGTLVVTILSTIVGCITSVLVLRSKVLIVSLCTSVTFFLLLLAITAMFFGGQYSGGAVTLLTIAGSGIGTALIAGQYLNRPKRYHKRAKL